MAAEWIILPLSKDLPKYSSCYGKGTHTPANHFMLFLLKYPGFRWLEAVIRGQ